MLRRLLLLGLTGLLSGCIHVKLDPVEVHATVDVNVKVDQAVSSLLTDVYGDSATVKPQPVPPAAP
jgi:hypothetical protein